MTPLSKKIPKRSNICINQQTNINKTNLDKRVKRLRKKQRSEKKKKSQHYLRRKGRASSRERYKEGRAKSEVPVKLCIMYIKRAGVFLGYSKDVYI